MKKFVLIVLGGMWFGAFRAFIMHLSRPGSNEVSIGLLLLILSGLIWAIAANWHE